MKIIPNHRKVLQTGTYVASNRTLQAEEKFKASAATPIARFLRKKNISSEISQWILQTFSLQTKYVSKRIRPHYDRIMFSEFHTLNEDFLTQLCRQTLKTTFELIRLQFWMKSQYPRCNFL